MESALFAMLGTIVGAIVSAAATRTAVKKQVRAAEDREIRRLAIEVSVAKCKMYHETFLDQENPDWRVPEDYYSSSYDRINEFIYKKFDPKTLQDIYKRIDEAEKRSQS